MPSKAKSLKTLTNAEFTVLCKFWVIFWGILGKRDFFSLRRGGGVNCLVVFPTHFNILTTSNFTPIQVNLLPPLTVSPVQTAPTEFENGVLTLKTHQMSVHSAPEEILNATITSHFGFVYKEKLINKN